ncbi:MAG TPA: Ig-like domain-containing protein [Vicinamibacteria bacterium]|nr:Ig-like domain-containing protein [Vicinamibacteria bacterium]
MPFGSPSTRWRQRTLTLGVGLAIALPATAAILPPDRLTTWNPGVPGGVPARTTICATVNASTYGNGLSDATAGIQAALNGCPVGQVVSLSAGNFLITSVLQISKGVVLRGQGPTQTSLKMPVGTNSNLVTIGTQWPSLIQSTNLATDAVKETQTVTLASNPGLAVGEVVVVDQLTDSTISQWSPASPPGDASRGWFSRFDRPVGQVMEIASVSGTTVTFTTPFHITFQTAFSAQLSRFTDGSGSVIPVVKYGGVEDLYVSGGSQGQGNVWLNSAYSWVKNVESDYQDGKSVALNLAFRCIVRDSYIHSTQDPSPGGGGYGIAVSYYSADNLIENNIVWNMNKVMVMQASGGGNVIGYNYMEDGWIAASPGFPETGVNASHMTTAHYELFEGNQSWNFDGDSYWGNAVYITVFRNHFTGKRRSVAPLVLTDAANRHAIGIMGGHWWYSFVGNVLGTSGQNPLPFTSFQYEESYPWPDDPVPMWKLGYDQYWGATSADPKVLSTVIRGGNFDYVTNSVHWENLTQQTLPNSLYLTAKPGFFGNNPWPWVDPTGATPLSTLPARARFDAGNPNPTTYTLSVAKAGTGSGTVTSSPGGINCGASCSASYTAATLVTLTAAPGAGSLFSGWSACSGTGTCQVTMSAAQSATATFTLSTTPPTVSLTAPSTGQTVSGSVTVSATASDVVGVAGVQFKLDGANLGAEVTASPYSISWATTGSTNGSHTLTAVARDTANNTATSSPVTVTISNVPPPTLSINDVVAATTSAVFTVTLSAASTQTVTVVYATADGTATAGTDYVAAGGNLSFTPGTTTQTIPVQVLGAPRLAAKTFFVNLSTPTGATITKGQGQGTIGANTYTLSVAKAGTGSGAVTSSPAGINCGTACSANYPAATLVTLTAAPAAGSLFSNWSACSGTGSCQVTMSAAQSVTATFTLSTTPPTVSLTAPSTGQTVSGSVTVSATASDVVGVAGVQFKLDGANLGAEVTASPYSIPWATTGSTNGSHTLTAVARDTANNTATSSPVTVTASNIPSSTLSINDVSVTEPNTGTANAVFTVTLSPASSQTVTVAYATADGTATAGTDYAAATGNLSFSAGTTTQTLTVQITGDTLPEPNETFFVNLSGPTGATLAKAQGTGTIVDAYVPPPRAWQDGPTVFTSHTNCTTGAVEQLTSQRVGYVGTTDVTFPRASDVYYSRVVVSTVGTACTGPNAHVEVVLPPSTQFEISAGHPVLCYSTSPAGVTTQIVTGCPQTVIQGNHGWTLDSMDPANRGPWALPKGATLEIQFPVRSLQKLSGATTSSYLQSYVQAIDGSSNPWGNSTQPVLVGDTPPGSRLGQGGADFDNDLRADPTVYYQANGLWYVRQSSTASTFSMTFGGTGYTPVSGDFDWDGHADLAVYQQSSGLWFIRKSSTGTTYSLGFGGPGFTPVPADYDGDQQTDVAVYHQASGLWYINKSTTLTTTNVGFGGTGYAPVPKDYDGDGKTDLAVYHQASGLWFIQQSSTGAVITTGFGGPGFVPVPRDYDGDGKADLAVFYPASGLWYIRPSGGGPDIVQGFGGSAYTPVPADYDGDGKADIAVYHEPSGLWFIKQSTTGTTVSFAYGGSGFTPVNY